MCFCSIVIGFCDLNDVEDFAINKCISVYALEDDSKRHRATEINYTFSFMFCLKRVATAGGTDFE